MSKQALVVIANGTEEVEALTAANVLSRGGVQVTIASAASSLDLEGSRGLPLKATAFVKDCTQVAYDMIVLPGGMPGAKHLRDCDVLCDMLKAQRAKSGGWIAAICASPAIVLADLKLLDKKATCYPGMDLGADTENTGAPYEVSGNVVTGKGPGTAMRFALKCVEVLTDKANAEKVMKALLLDSY